METKNVIFYTDGAATMINNNGEYVRCNGGWAFAEIYDEENYYSESGGEAKTTNNCMELMAIDKALSHFLSKPCIKGYSIKIYSDSAYCVNIFTNWVYNWECNDWKRSHKKLPIENVELIKDIWNKIKIIRSCFCSVEFIKVKGHSNNKWNNIVDELAVKAKENVDG